MSKTRAKSKKRSHKSGARPNAVHRPARAATPPPRKQERRLLSVFAAAFVLAGALIGASQLSAHLDAKPAPASPKTAQTAPAAMRDSLLVGIPQRSNALGSPTAPVTLVEYADLQCPYCAEWAIQTLPVLVEDYVRTGKLRIVFRGLAFIGPDSRLALETAVAAGAENRLWDVVHGLYQAQGAENSGWVTDALLADIAARAGVDYGALAAARSRPFVERGMTRFAQAATAAGVDSTPSFELGRTGKSLRLVQIRSLAPDGIVPAVEAVLRGE